MRLTSGILRLVDTTRAPLMNTARSIPNETCRPAPTSKPPRSSSRRSWATGFQLAMVLRASGTRGSWVADGPALPAASNVSGVGRPAAAKPPRRSSSRSCAAGFFQPAAFASPCAASRRGFLATAATCAAGREVTSAAPAVSGAARAATSDLPRNSSWSACSAAARAGISDGACAVGGVAKPEASGVPRAATSAATPGSAWRALA